MKPYILVILLFILFISSCSFVGSGDGDLDLPNPFEGSEGLRISFREGFPPSTVVSGRTFPIIIDVENRGAKDIEDGIIVVAAEPQLIPKIEPDEFIFNIPGKSNFNLEPGKDILTLEATSKLIEQDYSDTNPVTTFRAEACYVYWTTLSTGVCIDTQKFKLEKEQKACETKHLSLKDQGAPVAIKRVEVFIEPLDDFAKVQPRFRIFIENVGGGDIVNQDKLRQVCGGEPLDNNPDSTFRQLSPYNKITYLVRLGKTFLSCEPEGGFFNFAPDEQNFFDCTYQEGYSAELGPFMQDFDVLLVYGYRTRTTKGVELEKERFT